MKHVGVRSDPKDIASQEQLGGGSDPTKLPLSGGKMTGAIDEAMIRAHNLDSGTGVGGGYIVDTDLVSANTIQANGSSDLVGLGSLPSGAMRVIIFSGSPIIRYNVTKMLLLTGADIQVRSGDIATFKSLGFDAGQTIGNWKMTDYARFDGTALASSGSGPANTDALPEGTANLYFTAARAQAANTDKVLLSSVGSANGVAPLGSDSKIASAYLPSYVDDVLEYANLAAFPAVGETGKIYIALDTNREYRWSGSTYIQLVASPGTTDNVPEGTTNQYFTAARVLSTVLAGLSLATGTAVVATDSILVAAGKLQKQITDLAAAISGKEPTIAAGTSAQYWNGAKSFVDFAGSVRSAVLTAISFATSTPVTAADSVLTAIGKLQAQLTAYGGVFRTEAIATASVGQTSYAVPNGYTTNSIIVFFNGALLAPADFTATDGANVVLASGALTTSDIMSVLVIGAVRAQDDALLQYTVASLPAASANLAKVRYCTNMAGRAGPVYSDGTNWRRFVDDSVVTT